MVLPRLVLASGSPQRRAILETLGIPFDVRVSGVEEREEGPPEEVAVENARRKALAVADGLSGEEAGRVVLGADTLVALDGRIYGKPPDAAHARETLLALRGRRHVVVGGICLIRNGRSEVAVASTTVRFRDFPESLLGWYLACGEWRERAGGYAIQGRGAALVESIEGDYLNVVGLPLVRLLELVPDLLG